MSSQELMENVISAPPVEMNAHNDQENEDMPVTDLFEDIEIVKNHLDCLGLKYDPNYVANCLLELDSNVDRVNIVVNKIIDEPPDIEITFERNSPSKLTKSSSNNATSEQDDSILEIQVVKKNNAPIVEKMGNEIEQPISININSDDDFVPSPSKLFRSVNPSKNIFMADILNGGSSGYTNSFPDPSYIPSTSREQPSQNCQKVNDLKRSGQQTIGMSEIEEFLDNKEINFIDVDPSFTKLNQRLNELRKRSPQTSNKIMKRVLKSASAMAKHDLKCGVISPLNDMKNDCTSQLNILEEKIEDQAKVRHSVVTFAKNLVTEIPNTLKTSGLKDSIHFLQNNKREVDSISNENVTKCNSLKRVSEITAQFLESVAASNSIPASPMLSRLSSNDASSSVSQLSIIDENLNKINSITTQFKNSVNCKPSQLNAKFYDGAGLPEKCNPNAILKVASTSATGNKACVTNSQLCEGSSKIPKSTKPAVKPYCISDFESSSENLAASSGWNACDLDLMEFMMDDVNSKKLEAKANIRLPLGVLKDAKEMVNSLIEELVDTTSDDSTPKSTVTEQPAKTSNVSVEIKVPEEEPNKTSTSQVDELLNLAQSIARNVNDEISKSSGMESNIISKTRSERNVNGESSKSAGIKRIINGGVRKSNIGIKYPKGSSPIASLSKAELLSSKASTSGTTLAISQTVSSKSDSLNALSTTEPIPSTSRNRTESMPKYLPSLMEIFPEANTGYLRDLCETFKGKEEHKDQVLQQLIDTVMENPNYPRRSLPKSETKTVSLSVDEKYQNIFAILPNIDPEFLENKCKELTDETKYSTFVNELLTTKQYPTIKDYERRKETEKSIKAYTNNFTIPGFLEVFPDPEDYFLNKKPSHHPEHSIAYLKDRYKYLRAEDISKAYKLEKSNLTKTCIRLDSHQGAFRKTKRNPHECRWPAKNDVNFLQEISYINNRKEIKDYIQNKKAEKEKAFKLAKLNNELFTCGCCFDDEVMNEEVVTCSEGHIFCQNCVKKFSEIKLGERSSKVDCMASDCSADFTLKVLQKVLQPNAFSRLVKIKQSDEIKAAGIEGLVSCPFCDFASIPPPEDKVFKCLNPDCMKESCRLCNEESHVPFRCDEVEKNTELAARLLIEEKMTQALMRECYKCKTKFIKADGCNKMTCTHCGAKSCYICREPVTGYEHFNGDNGDQLNKCPLYSENDLLHVEAVRITALEMKNKLLKENPNLNLVNDPTLMLPESSYKEKQKVPHYRQQQRGLVLNRVVPDDIPRDHLPPVDLTRPQPVIPPHLQQPNAAHQHAQVHDAIARNVNRYHARVHQNRHPVHQNRHPVHQNRHPVHQNHAPALPNQQGHHQGYQPAQPDPAHCHPNPLRPWR